MPRRRVSVIQCLRLTGERGQLDGNVHVRPERAEVAGELIEARDSVGVVLAGRAREPRGGVPPLPVPLGFLQRRR